MNDDVLEELKRIQLLTQEQRILAQKLADELNTHLQKEER
jgi:hypothetical protein